VSEMAAKTGLGSQRDTAVLKVRAKMLEASRSWSNEHGFVEVQGPVILPAVGERPNSFRLNYFGKDAFLSGGLQPYSDIFVEMFGKVFTVAPAFRAEPLRDNRHLTEFWRIEVAASGLDLNGLIRVEEDMIARVCRVLCEDVADELRLLRGSTSGLERINAPFPKITYDEAVEQLQTAGCQINWGEPLGWEFEHKLSLMNDLPFFVTKFPVSGETLLYKANPEKTELSLCADLLAPEGYGEIAGGGESVTDRKALLRKLREMKIELADRRWYLGLRRFGSVPQSGFALGVERLLCWVCKLPNVGEAIAFPRTHNSIYP
jgi:asparaginyl-tRNA synthetase